MLWCVWLIMGTLIIVICSQEAHQTYEFFSWENIEFIRNIYHCLSFTCNIWYVTYQSILHCNSRENYCTEIKNNLFRIQMAGEVTLTSQDGQEISKFRIWPPCLIQYFQRSPSMLLSSPKSFGKCFKIWDQKTQMMKLKPFQSQMLIMLSSRRLSVGASKFHQC